MIPASARAAATLVLCALTAAAEVALLLAVTPEPGDLFPGGLVLLAFVLGPPAFLAVCAWRRKAHPSRSALLLGVAVVVALVGLAGYGFDCYRYRTDPPYRLSPERPNPILFPLLQWGIILAVWVPLAIREGREKRAAADSP